MKIKTGDIWNIGNHQLLCGDSTSEPLVKDFIKEKTIKVCIADPPYGVGYKAQAKCKNSALYQLTVKNDHIVNWSKTFSNISTNVLYTWYATTKMDIIASALEEAGYKIRQGIVWKKNNSTLSRHFYHLKHEPCIFASKVGVKSKDLWTGDRKQHSVIESSSLSPKKRIHPTQKPVEVYLPMITNHTLVNEWVIDPFAGSGTIFEAAEQTGRKAMGIEISPELCKKIIGRFESVGMDCQFHRNIFDDAKKELSD